MAIHAKNAKSYTVFLVWGTAITSIAAFLLLISPSAFAFSEKSYKNELHKLERRNKKICNSFKLNSTKNQLNGADMQKAGSSYTLTWPNNLPNSYNSGYSLWRTDMKNKYDNLTSTNIDLSVEKMQSLELYLKSLKNIEEDNKRHRIFFQFKECFYKVLEGGDLTMCFNDKGAMKLRLCRPNLGGVDGNLSIDQDFFQKSLTNNNVMKVAMAKLGKPSGIESKINRDEKKNITGITMTWKDIKGADAYRIKREPGYITNGSLIFSDAYYASPSEDLQTEKNSFTMPIEDLKWAKIWRIKIAPRKFFNGDPVDGLWSKYEVNSPE